MKRYVLLAVLACVAGCRHELPPSADGRKDVPMKLVDVRPFDMGKPDAVLLLTGGTNGMMEVCNCSGPMPGGLSRRSGLVESYRKSFPDAMLIDVGDAFWVEPSAVRNEYMLKGYEQIGYDAVVLGDQEWAAGRKRLAKMLRANKTPALSSTVCAPDVPAMRVFKRELPNGTKLAVVSETTGEAFHFVPGSVKRTLTFSPEDETEKRIEGLKIQGYVVVLVAHTVEKDVEKIAARTKADVVVRANTTKTGKKLVKVGDTPVIKIGGHDYVAAVAIKADGSKMTALEYRPELVDTTWPINGSLLLTYQAYAHDAMRRALDAERTEGLAYQSSESCGKCHEKQLENWKTTHHARAWATLQKVKRTSDPACVMCHTSGFGTKKGFYTFEKTPNLANVNCQDCHRFNQDEHRKKGFEYRKVSRELCQTCHTPVTDPKFDFDKKRKMIRCPADDEQTASVR